MKKLIPALIFLLAVFFSVFFLFIRQEDERQIRRNLTFLATKLSQLGNEGELKALANIREIKLLFTRDCRIAAGAPMGEIRGQDMLVSALHQARRTVNRIEVGFYDISTIIEENQITAKTTMTAMATRLDPQIGEWEIEAREVEMRWRKVGEEWKIAEVQLVRILR